MPERQSIQYETITLWPSPRGAADGQFSFANDGQNRKAALRTTKALPAASMRSSGASKLFNIRRNMGILAQCPNIPT
jgi:hypothetical protein